MFSVPPATMIASGSSSMARTPSAIAFIPLPQTMFNAVPLTLSGIPEKMTTWRAAFWYSPAWITDPKNSSLTSFGSMRARRIASLTARAPRRGAGTSEKEPLNLPIGVRAAPAMTTLVPGFTSPGRKGAGDKSMVPRSEPAIGHDATCAALSPGHAKDFQARHTPGSVPFRRDGHVPEHQDAA